MTKKKSFITLLLVFCMIIPAMFMISACGATVETTVTLEQWQNALNFEGATDYYYKSESTLYTIEYKVNATSASLLQTRKDNENIQNKWIYLVEEDAGEQVVFKYQYNKGDATYTRTNTYVAPENIASVVNQKSDFNQIVNAFDSFEYDEEAKAYSSKTPVVYSGVSSNVTLKFENGRLVKVEYTYASGANEGQGGTVEITYGNTVVDQLPANIEDLLK